MLTSIRGQQLVISSLFCVLCFHSSITVDGLRVPNRYNVEDCKNELRLGLQTLQDMSVRIADHEFGRRDKLKKELEEKAQNFEFKSPNKLDGDEDLCQCGDLISTPMFPDPTIDSDQVFTSFFQYSDEENDPVLNFYREWTRVLQMEEEVCNGPKFESFASVTPEQLHGFLANFATNYAGPLCPACHQVVEAFRQQAMSIIDSFPKEDHLFLQLFLTHFPSSETLCSLLFPSCHSELIGVSLPENVVDKYNASQCFTCQFCMTGTTLLEHKFLLVPEVYELVFQIFNATLIPNFCTELCLAYPPCNSTSPFALPYKQCLSKTEETYHTGIKMLQKIMIPKQFCTKLQIFGQKYQFCEDPSPTPNILHCLKDYCQDIQAQFTQLRLVCDLIPDHPKDADQYLNIKRPTKSANSFGNQNSRTEL
ncbi:hypothetical protein M3Y96_00186400 [Aphelenchoides besseyi]|nr:hypothetical protein M3Y96_00186400 [Aphelenchoides besseyi]